MNANPGDQGPGRTCSIRNCSRPAIESETGGTERWEVSVFYCDEHIRELREGVPVGPVGIDPAKAEFTPRGAAEPRTGGRWEASPH
jgi:hypothetical protein